MVRIYSPSRDEIQARFANQFKDIVKKQERLKEVASIIRDYAIMLFIFMILCLIVCLPALV